MRLISLFSVTAAALVLGTSVGFAQAPAPAATRSNFDREIAPLLETYCAKCHMKDEPEGDFSLEFKSGGDLVQRAKTERPMFQKMGEVLRDREMPPEDKPQPTEQDRERLLAWIDRDLLALDPNGPRNPGHVAAVRRLSNVEYANTVRDLLDLANFTVADDFPADNFANGFDNMADVLTYSTSHMEHYLGAAEEAIKLLDGTAVVGHNWDKNYGEPAGKVFDSVRELRLSYDNNQYRVRVLLETFLPRAYRRPVKSGEIDRLMDFARISLAQEGESFIRPKSSYAPIRAALLSPYFLFRVETDPPSGIASINEFELASRLSYFLWSSMPDDELFDLAQRGELRAHQKEQVIRMLKDPKARALTDNFAEQWLKLRALNKINPDPALFPDFNDALRQAMMEETKRFFASGVAEDRSIMDLLDANYTFVNETLARHYGMAGVSGDEFRRVTHDPAAHRGGLLTNASVLTLTSAPNRTSPVKRGVWVLETIFNNPPPPPPPNVPPLEADGKVLTGTVRQVLAQHRDNAQCASCHARIDPMGLALENFDAVGRWREREAGAPVDASGMLPAGQKFATLEEFRAVLKTKQPEFRRSVVQHLLVYALGRGLEYYDKLTVDDICAAATRQDNRFSSVILAIVESDVFQKRQAREKSSHDNSLTTVTP
jgi:Protein of unknown function (DUF1592)/Protein of unknown function (DUF1588)/Protein of unknown function (DUF1585)/Protein of unknown function (DUF1587)/Protein of unknown function (DUF1595)/Planctomycete cytochrome C